MLPTRAAFVTYMYWGRKELLQELQAFALYRGPSRTGGRAFAFLNASELVCEEGTVEKLKSSAFQRCLGRVMRRRSGPPALESYGVLVKFDG